MSHTNPPDPGNVTKQLFTVYQELITEIGEILSGRMDKVTLVISGRSGSSLMSKVIKFPPGHVPPEFSTFLEAYANRLASMMLAIDDKTVLLRLGNVVVSLEDFLKDYSTGPYPAINESDRMLVWCLTLMSIASIQINGKTYSIQRIN